MVSTPHMHVASNSWEYDDWSVRHKAVPATIAGSYDGQFTCVIDPGHVSGRIDGDGNESDADVEKYRFRRTMRAHRIIRFLDEPDMPVCKNGRVQRAGTCDAPDGGCYCAQEAEEAFAEDAA